jgi:hypothetical protein
MSGSAGGLQIRAASHTSSEHIITGKKRPLFPPILTIVTIMLALSLAARYACRAQWPWPRVKPGREITRIPSRAEERLIREGEDWRED